MARPALVHPVLHAAAVAGPAIDVVPGVFVLCGVAASQASALAAAPAGLQAVMPRVQPSSS